MATITELQHKLDVLFEEQRQQKAELAVVEEEFKLLERHVRSGMSVSMARQFEALKEALPRGRQRVADTELAIKSAREALERAQAAQAAARPRDRDDAMIVAAIDYRAAAMEVEQAAQELAAKIRVALARGETFAAATGSDQARRLFQLGYFRQRLAAGLVRLFERDPDPRGIWGAHGALLELGEAKNSRDIAKVGFAEYELRTLRSLLPSDIGEVL